MSKKNLFVISYDLETGEKRLEECNYEELGWSKNEYAAELLNCLTMAIGIKIKIMVKSEKVKNMMFELIIARIKDYIE